MENLPEIKNQLGSKDLFDAFKAQLEKDFEQCNFPTDFVEALVPEYACMHEKIAAELQLHEKIVNFSMMKLLNRIDISEAQLKRYLQENKNDNHFAVIAELIIKRILQKVVIKQFYKSKES